jgi:O-antigen/teichoic acid export membrane protein
MYRPVLVFSLPLVAVQGLGFVNTNVDIYMIGYFLDSSSLAVYNISLQLGNMVTAVLSTIGFLLPPILTKLDEENKRTEMLRSYQVLTKWMVVLVLPVFVVLFYSPRIVIGTFFGGSYTAGVLALRILLVGKLLAIIMGLNFQALVALGNNKIVSYITVIQTVINVILNYLLVPIFGFEGAAVGLTLSIIVGDVIGVTVLYRRTGLHAFTRSVISPAVVTNAVAAGGYVLLSSLGFPTSLTVAIVGFTYVPIVIILAMEPEDERLFSEIEEQLGYDLDPVRQTLYSLRHLV